MLKQYISLNSDRKLDVRLNPITDEYCTNRKPCVLYGISSVCISQYFIRNPNIIDDEYKISSECLVFLQNTTEILLPRDPMIELEHHECSVMLGCMYDVLVETTDRMLRQTTKYTVPGNE